MFTTDDDALRYEVMFTIDDDAFLNRSLRETENLTTEKVLYTWRAHELAESQINEMIIGGITPLLHQYTK